jgi:hypothetical protein
MNKRSGVVFSKNKGSALPMAFGGARTTHA